jgi:hypothetical protein
MIGLVVFVAIVAGAHAVLAAIALRHNRRYDAARKD